MKKPFYLILSLLLALTLTCKDEPNDSDSDTKPYTPSTPPPPPPPSYTVIYNANGGSGVMESSTHIIGTAQTLRINAFTCAGHDFSGWAISSTGTVKYTDGEEVTDLTTTGKTITLYAVWDIILIVPGSTLAEKLAWLQTNAQSYIEYNIEVTADEDIPPTNFTFSYDDDKEDIKITLTGMEAEHTIGLSSVGSMFTVGQDVTLTLNGNITLRGRSDNNASLVRVNSGGKFVMNEGVRITGNTNTEEYGMEKGGGVKVSSGTFIMNGGEISGNTADSFGGGVYVEGSQGTFMMKGGVISGNTADAGGGGMFVDFYATVLIQTGTIYGSNEADTSLKNTGYMGAALGLRGVFTIQYGTFNEYGWWSSKGNITSSTSNTIRIENGVQK